MKFRSTLGLLLVVVVLAAGVWWFELRDSGPVTGREDHLLPFSSDSLSSIELQHSGTRYMLRHRDQGWVMLSPVEAPCDEAVMARLLTVLDEALVEQNVGKGDEERYGLQAPTSTMTVYRDDGQTATLEFGRINPLQTLVYLKRQGSDDVLLSTSELLTLSLNTEFGWRDKTIVDIDPDAVHRVRLRTLAAGEISVARGEHGLWYVDGDIRWRADPVRMQNLLLMLTQMQAVGVSAESKMNPENYGLGTRGLSAYLEDAQGTIIGDIVLGWGQGEEANYVIVPDKPEVFRVGGNLGVLMTAFTKDCRDRKVFPGFDPTQVTRIEVNSASDAFAIEKKSITRWGVVHSSHHDSTFVLDPERIQQTLETLLAMEVDEFPEPQPASKLYVPAEMTVTLHGEAGHLAGVQVGRKDPDGFFTFMRGLEEPAVILVQPGKLIELPFDLQRLGYEAVEVSDPEG